MYEIKKEIDNGDGTGTLVLGDFINMEYGISCLLCNETIPYLSSPQQICDECKKALAWVKEKMKEKDNE